MRTDGAEAPAHPVRRAARGRRARAGAGQRPVRVAGPPGSGGGRPADDRGGAHGHRLDGVEPARHHADVQPLVGAGHELVRRAARPRARRDRGQGERPRLGRREAGRGGQGQGLGRLLRRGPRHADGCRRLQPPRRQRGDPGLHHQARHLGRRAGPARPGAPLHHHRGLVGQGPDRPGGRRRPVPGGEGVQDRPLPRHPRCTRPVHGPRAQGRRGPQGLARLRRHSLLRTLLELDLARHVRRRRLPRLRALGERGPDHPGWRRDRSPREQPVQGRGNGVRQAAREAGRGRRRPSPGRGHARGPPRWRRCPR